MPSPRCRFDKLERRKYPSKFVDSTPLNEARILREMMFEEFEGSETSSRLVDDDKKLAKAFKDSLKKDNNV